MSTVTLVVDGSAYSTFNRPGAQRIREALESPIARKLSSATRVNHDTCVREGREDCKGVRVM